MTISQTLIAAAAALVCGGSVALVTGHDVNPDIAAIPWDKLLGVGSGGLAFGVAVYFLAREERMRVAHDALLQRALESTRAVASEFASTVDRILAEHRSETERMHQRVFDTLTKG